MSFVRYVVAEAGHREILKDVSIFLIIPTFEVHFKIPENGALEGLAGAMVEAWRIYNKPKSVIMFLIEDVTYNICDQKFHEFEIRRQCPDVFVIRKTLTEIAERGVMKEVVTPVVWLIQQHFRTKAFGLTVMRLL